MYFGTYRLRKTWLDKCVKSVVSEDRSISGMINGPKHSRRLKASTFIIIIHDYEGF